MSKMLCVADYEEHAKKHLNRQAWAFYSQGAEREFTVRDNLRSFTRYAVLPRMLRNTAERDLSVTVLGEKLPFPIGVAPSAHQRLAHPEGEMATSRAAAELGTIYTLSSVSNTPLEDVATTRVNNSPQWMQIYQFKSRALTEEVVRAAEKNGYRALVLTVDTPVVGLQLKMMRNGLDLPPHIRVPLIDKALKNSNATSGKDHNSNVNLLEDTLTWKDVAWLKSFTHLPIVLKGILSVGDALEAVKHGASAVWVSNHGGRQTDGVPTAMEVLPGIASALSGSGCEVYADGGVRWGSDVFKLLALGARAVFIGRPAIWGLAHSGQNGVRSVLEILKAELDRAMHLSGCSKISDIGPHLIKKRPLANL